MLAGSDRRPPNVCGSSGRYELHSGGRTRVGEARSLHCRWCDLSAGGAAGRDARYRRLMASRNRPPKVPPGFEVDHDGKTFEFSRFTARVAATATGVEVPAGRFNVCPICLVSLDGEGAGSAEHVPPQSLGGQVMTWTCERCNNDLGTAEEELRKLVELETTVVVQAADGSVPGRRRARVALRSAAGRPPGAFIESAAPGVEDVLKSGTWSLTVNPLDMPLVWAAMLKQSYLAACLLMREVPDTPGVKQVRAVLLAARDRDQPALEAALEALKAFGGVPAHRWVEAPAHPPLAWVSIDGGVGPWQFVLGGRFTLPWPFPDVGLVFE